MFELVVFRVCFFIFFFLVCVCARVACFCCVFLMLCDWFVIFVPPLGVCFLLLCVGLCFYYFGVFVIALSGCSAQWCMFLVRERARS